MIGEAILLVLLMVLAYRDCLEKKIYIYGPMICGIAAIVLQLLFREHTWLDLIAGAAIGGVVFLIAWIGRECIGFGDGLVLFVCGLFLGFWRNVTLFLTALALAAVTALFLLVIKRKGKKCRLPFVPFLLVAYLLQML